MNSGTTPICKTLQNSLAALFAGLVLLMATMAPAAAQNGPPPKSLMYPQGWTECAQENGWCNFYGGIRDVAYGAQGQFVYLLSVSDNLMCGIGQFWNDDPAPGVRKTCWVSNGKSRFATAAVCAAENGTCNVTGSGTVWFGGSGQFFPKTISAAEGQTTAVGCNNSVFGDPASGKIKYCVFTP